MKFKCLSCGAILSTKVVLNSDWEQIKAKKEDSFNCPVCDDIMAFKANNRR